MGRASTRNGAPGAARGHQWREGADGIPPGRKGLRQALNQSPLGTGLANQEFRGRVIDDAPLLLEQSYRLRYRVYCLQRHFLRAEDYRSASNMTVSTGTRCTLVCSTRQATCVAPHGWCRRVAAAASCHCFATAQSSITTPNCRTRRTVSWRYRGSRSVAAPAQVDTAAPFRPRLKDGGPSRRCSSRSIRRPSASGPPTGWRPQRSHSNAELKDTAFHSGDRAEFDYGGPVRPYLINLAEFDSVILSDRHPMLKDFLMGLEPEFRPYAIRDAPLSSVQGGR